MLLMLNATYNGKGMRLLKFSAIAAKFSENIVNPVISFYCIFFEFRIDHSELRKRVSLLWYNKFGNAQIT